MDRFVFKENLLKVLEEISNHLNLKLNNNILFTVVPILENGKKYNSTDDYMRLTLFSDKNLKDRYLNISEVVDLFSGLAPIYPTWINVLFKGSDENTLIFELQTSLRFRKPSQIKYRETGHAPFNAILNFTGDL